MKTLSKILLVCCAGLSLGGCKTLQPPSGKVVHDTLTVKTTVTIHDTVFVAPAASVTDTVILKELFYKPFKPVLKSYKNAKLTAQVIDSSLVMGCYCDTVAIKAQLTDTRTDSYSSHVSTEVLPPERIEYVPKWRLWLEWIGGLSFVILVIQIVIRVCKYIYGR